MRIQETSKDIIERGTLFPGSKTSHMEGNTQKNKEIGVSAPRQHSHSPGTHLCAHRHMLRCVSHGSRRLALGVSPQFTRKHNQTQAFKDLGITCIHTQHT